MEAIQLPIQLPVASVNLPLNYRVLKTLTVGDTISKREGGHEKVKEAKKIISIITSSVTAAPLPTIQLLLHFKGMWKPCK